MKFSVLTSLLLVCWVSACDGGAIAEGEGEGEGEGDPAATAYQNNCASCHGDGGAGSSVAPHIQNPVEAYATWVVRNGHDVMDFPDPMAPFSTDVLSDDDLALVLSFLGSQTRPTDGPGLYERFCINCHGSTGANGRVNHDIAGHDLGEVLQTVREGHRPSLPGDIEFMPAYATTFLSDDEVTMIAAVIAAL